MESCARKPVPPAVGSKMTSSEHPRLPDPHIRGDIPVACGGSESDVRVALPAPAFSSARKPHLPEHQDSWPSVGPAVHTLGLSAAGLPPRFADAEVPVQCLGVTVSGLCKQVDMTIRDAGG